MSLKGEKYETIDEITTRLSGTVVLYDKRPVYISEITTAAMRNEGGGDDKFRVHIKNLPLRQRDDSTRKYISSKNFDMAPFSMGYLNYQGNAYYLTRSTRRQYSQGAKDGNVSISRVDACDIDGGGEAVGRGNVPRFLSLIQDQSFMDMCDKRYPTFNEAMASLASPEVTSVAISQSFAVTIDRNLDILYIYHRGSKCALALQGDAGITIPKKYHFIRHELEELGIPCKAK